MFLACFNAPQRDSDVAQQKGGGWDVVTAGSMAMQGARNDSAGALASSQRRCSGVAIRSHGHTGGHTYRQWWSEGRSGSDVGFDLIPYAAAGWERQVSRQERTRETGQEKCHSALPGALDG
jgi:hypothetical protein